MEVVDNPYYDEGDETGAQVTDSVEEISMVTTTRNLYYEQ